MNTENKFTYLYDNITLYQFNNDWILFIISLVVGILFMIIIYKSIQTLAFYSIQYHSDLNIKKKKRTLGELIIMKDIQTELEKEIEQAILKAAFHS